jgi:hypothetical protein
MANVCDSPGSRVTSCSSTSAAGSVRSAYTTASRTNARAVTVSRTPSEQSPPTIADRAGGRPLAVGR